MHHHEALELFREAECLVDQQTVKAAIDRMASCIHADLPIGSRWFCLLCMVV